MFKLNPMLLVDFYKCSHAELYEQNGSKIYATWTPRKSRIDGVDEVVVFGLQSFIKQWFIEYFDAEFFNKPIEEVLDNYFEVIRNCINSEGLGEKRIRDLHSLGYLPLRIDALEEGTLCPIRVPMFTIENTLPEFFWLTNFVESFMSSELWAGMTSATLALQYRKILDKWAERTCDDNSHVDYQAHDFSLRGMNTIGASLVSGAGHLLSFKGTDTVPVIPWLQYYYGADIKTGFASSVPATEHSIMEFNSVGKENDEYDCVKRIITEVHPDGFVSVVSDTWNLWHVLTDTIPRLKEEILSRDGRVVIRPDSGIPEDIICGVGNLVSQIKFPIARSNEEKEGVIRAYEEEFSKIPYREQVEKGVIELLWDTFGGTVNSKGYKVLDSHIGAIYGDAITLERAEEICQRLEAKGFASSNIVFGIGSYTYQFNTRDTFGFALKSTYAIKEGKEVFLFKDPITDDGMKKSQKGMVFVGQDKDGKIFFEDEYYESDRQTYAKNNLLQPLFEDGKLLRETSLEKIKEKIKDAHIQQRGLVHY